MSSSIPSAVLAGLRFEAVPRDRSDAYVVTKWVGLDDGVTVRRDAVDRPGGHGSFDAPGYLSAGTFSLSGYVIAPTPEDLLHKRDLLTGLLAAGGTDDLHVQGERDFHIAVGLAGQTAVTVRGADPCVADFLLQLWAADPRKYGEVETFRGGEAASHKGNFEAAPELTIRGNMPSGYTVNGPDGKRYVVTQALTDAETHVIDMRTGWLYKNGALQSGAVGRAETWVIPPGRAVVMTITPVSGTGFLSVAVPRTSI